MNAPNPTDLVTVYRASNDVEAELVRSRLEAAGFHPIVLNEFSAINVFGTASNSTVTVFVQVPAAEAAEAREFLETPGPPAE